MNLYSVIRCRYRIKTEYCYCFAQNGTYEVLDVNYRKTIQNRPQNIISKI